MQIAMKLSISRDTVRRYQRMNEKEFEGLISSEILRRKRKLEAFEGFIKQLLQDCPFLSATQIHDRLKEHFPILPANAVRTDASSNTHSTATSPPAWHQNSPPSVSTLKSSFPNSPPPPLKERVCRINSRCAALGKENVIIVTASTPTPPETVQNG